MIISTIAVSFITTVGVFIKENVSINNISTNSYITSCYKKKKTILLEGFYVVFLERNNKNRLSNCDRCAILAHYSRKYQKNICDIKLHTPNLNNFLSSYPEDEETNSTIYDENKKRTETLKKTYFSTSTLQ